MHEKQTWAADLQRDREVERRLRKTRQRKLAAAAAFGLLAGLLIGSKWRMFI